MSVSTLRFACMSTPKSAAIYCRISKDARGEGLGVARQEQLCRDLADRKGWPVAKVYVDNDLSAYSGAPRPQYERMLEDLEAGTIDAVVVVDQDRLTRHPMELEGFIGLADRLGVPLANVSGDVDLSTSDGRFRARIMGAVARQESEKKSERLRRQRDQHAKRGKFHGGIRRFGYEPDGEGSLVVVEAEAKLIREAARRYLDGESLRQICLDWNERELETVTGGRWRVTSLRTCLSGPHIAGLRVHRGEIVGEAEWPAILDRDTWEQIRAKMGDPRKSRGGRPPAYLLTGILECWACGGPLHHSFYTDGTGRYMCGPDPGRPQCGRVAIAAAPVEEAVTGAVLDALAVPELFAAVEAHDADTDALTRQIQAAEERLDTLARHYAEGRISDREWLTARDAIDAQLEELRGQYPTEPQAVDFDPVQLAELWEAGTTDERRAIIGLVIDGIEVGPSVVDGKRRQPADRLTIRWNASAEHEPRFDARGEGDQ